MPNYIDSNLGGTGNSGVYPSSRPQINVADAIGAISKAYQNNKEGVLTRAMMQAQNQRANAELGLQTEQHQIALRQAGALPPDEVLGKYGATPPGSSGPAPGPIAAAVAGGAPLPGVSGLPSPGRITPIAPQTQPTPAMLPASAPAGPITASSGPPPMQITGGALPPVAPPITSAGGGSVMAGPSAAPASLSPAEQAARDGWQPIGGTGPHANWLVNPHKGTYAEQREASLNQQSLSAANDAYSKDHPGAPPLYTDAEIATGSRNPKAYAQLVGRMEGIRDKQLQAQTNYESLGTAKDAAGNPLDESTKRSIANDPLLMRQFVANSLNPAPPKEAKQDPFDLFQKEQEYKRTHPESRYSFHEGMDPATGKPVIYKADSTTGELTPTGIGAKTAGAGAQSQKAQTYVDLMQGAYPTMERLAGKIRPDVVAAAVLHPNAANIALSQDEQDYLASARSFLAGVLHQESGARLSHEQLNFGMLRYLPNVGDTPQTIQNKLASAKQVIQERASELGGGKGAPASGPSGGGMFDDLVPKK